MDQEYDNNNYNLFAMDFHKGNNRRLLEELICVRLSKDFQIVHAPNYTDSHRGEKVTTPLCSSVLEVAVQVYMALAHQYHRITYNEDDNNIEVFDIANMQL